MSIQKLINPPLQEVMFEAHWELEYDEIGNLLDRGLNLAQGRFATLVEDLFPVDVSLSPNNFVALDQPSVQFWKDSNTFPAIQLGHGVITVNDNGSNYAWKDNFKTLIFYALDKLQKSYKQQKLQFKNLRLKYINFISVSDDQFEDIKLFFSENLNIHLENKFRPKAKQKDILIAQSFELDDGSNFVITVNTAFEQHKQEYAVVWSLEVHFPLQIDLDKIPEWLETAHQNTSETFVKMLNPQFYDSFNRDRSSKSF